MNRIRPSAVTAQCGRAKFSSAYILWVDVGCAWTREKPQLIIEAHLPTTKKPPPLVFRVTQRATNSNSELSIFNPILFFSTFRCKSSLSLQNEDKRQPVNRHRKCQTNESRMQTRNQHPLYWSLHVLHTRQQRIGISFNFHRSAPKQWRPSRCRRRLVNADVYALQTPKQPNSFVASLILTNFKLQQSVCTTSSWIPRNHYTAAKAWTIFTHGKWRGAAWKAILIAFSQRCTTHMRWWKPNGCAAHILHSFPIILFYYNLLS